MHALHRCSRRATPRKPWITIYLQAMGSSGAGSKDDKPAAKAKKGALAVGDHLPDFNVETDASTDDSKVMQSSKVRLGPSNMCRQPDIRNGVALWVPGCQEARCGSRVVAM